MIKTTKLHAEFNSQEATWLAFPYVESEWGGQLDEAKTTLRHVLDVLDAAGETVRLLGDYRIAYGDCWLRDTMPIFATRNDKLVGMGGNFNGWGEKFQIPGDETVARDVCQTLGIEYIKLPLILEGGGIDTDGDIIITSDCLLHPRRNPNLNARMLRELLCESLSANQCLVFNGSLTNDHTDGHIDTLVRFVAKNKVVCMTPTDYRDPNYETLLSLQEQLALTDLEVVTVPSPGLVYDSSRNVAPASYVNFYIANNVVLVPTYGVDQDDAMLQALKPLFPNRQIVGINSRPLLAGGGAIHCCLMQQPKMEPS